MSEQITKHKSKIKIVLISLMTVIIILTVLKLGIVIGMTKSFRPDDPRLFGAKQELFFGQESPSQHGAFGEIISLNYPTIIIASPDNSEKIVKVDSKTVVRRNRDEINFNGLKVGEIVSVVGEPNENFEIEARLIRVSPIFEAEITYRENKIEVVGEKATSTTREVKIINGKKVYDANLEQLEQSLTE